MNALKEKRRKNAPQPQSVAKTSEFDSCFAPSALECDADSHRFCVGQSADAGPKLL